MSGLEFTMRVVADGFYRTAVNGIFGVIYYSSVFRDSESFPTPFGGFAGTISVTDGTGEGSVRDLLVAGIRNPPHC